VKKILLIICILSIIFSTGCGIFNLDDWVWPEDDLEFMAMVKELDTPEKIGDYMLNNFTCIFHGIYAPDPHTLWQEKEGDCNDFATFGMFIADYHDYETYRIDINIKNVMNDHVIAVYDEGLWYSITDSRIYDWGFNSFREIVENWSDNSWRYECKSYKVYDYWGNKVESGLWVQN